MRTDCTRDNRKQYLPNASHLGFDLWNAKRGNWIAFDDGVGKQFGRVLGRVHCEGKTYIEVIAALGCFDNPCVRWISPEHVLQCRENPPRNIFAFFAGDWNDPAAIIKQVEYGFSHE